MGLARRAGLCVTSGRGGTGLGLPTVRRIVEEHGGRLVMQSEPGKGTQFVIRLPIRRDFEDEPRDSGGDGMSPKTVIGF